MGKPFFQKGFPRGNISNFSNIGDCGFHDRGLVGLWTRLTSRMGGVYKWWRRRGGDIGMVGPLLRVLVIDGGDLRVHRLPDGQGQAGGSGGGGGHGHFSWGDWDNSSGLSSGEVRG